MPSSTNSPAKMRVLMLPGYLQNASIMEARVRPICEKLASEVEFVIIEPPHVQHVPTSTGTSSDDESFDHSGRTSKSSPRMWWFSGAERELSTNFGLFEETLHYLRKVLEEQGPFDGIFGFSQGSATATLLTTLIENPSLHPIFAKEGKAGVWPPKQFKFAVCVSGYRPMDERVQSWFAQVGPLNVPSLHVLGTGDTIISNENSLSLREQWTNPATEWHHGGHFIPNKASWRTLFQSYLESFVHADQQQVVVLEPTPFVSVPEIKICLPSSDTKRSKLSERRVSGSRSSKSSRFFAVNLNATLPSYVANGYGQHILLYR